MKALGVILAGGRSRRFGSPKALAELCGRPVMGRVWEALREVVPHTVLIANESELAAVLPLPHRPDLNPGHGPLGGVQAALRWAGEEGCDGALCVACDMPLLAPGLLREVLHRAEQTGAAAVAPESTHSRSEPLCAFYSVAALPEVDRRIAGGQREMRVLLNALEAERVSLAVVRRFGDPEMLFLNVNTPQDLQRAEQFMRSRAADAAR